MSRSTGPSGIVLQGSRPLGKVGGRGSLLFSSVKAGGIIAVESPAEETIAQLADLDPRVSKLRAQPFTIDVPTNRLLRTREELDAARLERKKPEISAREYTPDFEVETAAGALWVLESKTPRHTPDDAYWAKVGLAAALLRGRGYLFAVIKVPAAMNHPLVTNAALLTSFRRPSGGGVSAHKVAELERHAHELGTLADALQLCDLSLREAPVLFLTGLLSADLKNCPIRADMQVRYAGGDLSALELLPLQETPV